MSEFNNYSLIIENFSTKTFSGFTQNLSISTSDSNATSIVNKKILADEFLTRLEVILLFLVFLMTIIGNLCVIFILLFFKHGKIINSYRKHRNKAPLHSITNKTRFYFKFNKISRMSFYIIHLSIADINVALMSIVPQILWRNSVLFSRSQVECKMVAFGQVTPLLIELFC